MSSISKYHGHHFRVGGKVGLASFSRMMDSAKRKQAIVFSRQQQVNQRTPFCSSQGQKITKQNNPARLCCQRATGDAQKETDNINSHSDACWQMIGILKTAQYGNRRKRLASPLILHLCDCRLYGKERKKNPLSIV